MNALLNCGVLCRSNTAADCCWADVTAGRKTGGLLTRGDTTVDRCFCRLDGSPSIRWPVKWSGLILCFIHQKPFFFTVWKEYEGHRHKTRTKRRCRFYGGLVFLSDKRNKSNNNGHRVLLLHPTPSASIQHVVLQHIPPPGFFSSLPTLCHSNDSQSRPGVCVSDVFASL